MLHSGRHHPWKYNTRLVQKILKDRERGRQRERKTEREKDRERDRPREKDRERRRVPGMNGLVYFASS